MELVSGGVESGGSRGCINSGSIVLLSFDCEWAWGYTSCMGGLEVVVILGSVTGSLVGLVLSCFCTGMLGGGAATL